MTSIGSNKIDFCRTCVDLKVITQFTTKPISIYTKIEITTKMTFAFPYDNEFEIHMEYDCNYPAIMDNRLLIWYEGKGLIDNHKNVCDCFLKKMSNMDIDDISYSALEEFEEVSPLHFKTMLKTLKDMSSKDIIKYGGGDYCDMDIFLENLWTYLYKKTNIEK